LNIVTGRLRKGKLRARRDPEDSRPKASSPLPCVLYLYGIGLSGKTFLHRGARMMSESQIRIFDSAEELARTAAEWFVTLTREALAGSDRFAVALAGGSTPKRLYQLLAEPPCREQIDWSKLEIFWSDERAVPPDHPESNYKMAWDSLLSRVPVDSSRVHRLQGEATDADLAAIAYQQEIAEALGVSAGGPPPPFDLMLLGIGEDGHTASLFPYTSAIEERNRWVVANHVAQRQMHRLTMTLPILNRARNIVFLVAGASKAGVLTEILEGPSDPQRLPSQAVQPTDGQLYWWLDRQAAGE
jgi:6-phosphogluconolactonase